MSRVTKWKLEKTKVKVVFRLQFHATHIPLSGWDKLHLSFIPAESGKATAKTTKANVRNGSCKWADPVYETTRLLQDSKTKQYEEKLYKLVVAMGSSRSSVLGEATINLADYADASKPAAVQLPLQGSDSGAFLHVTVQLLTSKTGFREFEQQREISERGLQGNIDQDGLKHIPGDSAISHVEKVTSRSKFKPESKLLPSLEEERGLHEDYADSGAGFDGSSNTSGSVCAEKHDVPGSRDVDSIKSTVSGDLSGLTYNQPTSEKGGISNSCLIPEGTREWVQYYGSGILADNDLADSNLKKITESDDKSLSKIQMEINSLETHHAAIGTEVQKLTDQLSSEFSSTNELVKDVNLLKSECSKFRDDVQRLMNLKINPPMSRVERGSSNPILLKGIQITEDRLKGLLNKAFIGFHEKDYSFLIPDLESLCSFLLELKQETNTLVSSLDKLPGTGPDLVNISPLALPKTNDNGMTGEFGMDVCHPEGLLSMNIPGLASQETDPTMAMQGEIFKLLRELDESKAQEDSLTKKMDQMECYYEAFIQELEETQKQMMGELQSLRNEHSSCIYTISTTKAQMEAMHQEMANQLLQLAEDRLSLESRNKELERRVLTSEAALKRARLNYSIAVDQLQKDLEVLSLQVLSMYETNENLIKKAFSETSEPCFLGCKEETLQSEYLDVEVSFNPVLCQSQKVSKRNGGTMLSDNFKKSRDSHEELYQKIEDEILQMNFTNICLDISVKFLEETLRESRCVLMLKDQSICEMCKQLETSLLKLQILEHNIDVLTKDKASCVSKANKMSLLNQTLEEEIRRLTEENGTSVQRVADLEASMNDYISYKSRYEACDAEKLNLTEMLKELMAENGNLVNKVAEHEALVAEYRGYRSRYEACNADKMVLTSKVEELTVDNGNFVSKIADCEALLAENSSYKRKYEACNAEKMDLTSQLERLSAESGNLEIKTAEYEALAAECLDYKSRYEACTADKISLTRQLDNLTAENGILMNKVKECDALVAEYSSYKPRYEACDADKIALTSQLEELTAANETLVNKITEDEAQIAHYSSYKPRYEASDADKTSLIRSLEESAAENDNLMKKIAEYEALAEEYSRYKSRYEASVAQNSHLMRLLDDSNAESGSLVNKISLLEEEVAKRTAEFNELLVSKENLQKIVSYLQEKLLGLVTSHGHTSEKNSLSNTSLDREMDFEKFAGVLSALEEHHANASERVLQLMKEKKDVEEERDMASFSMTSKISEADVARQKFERDIYNVICKMDSSTAGLDRLQAKLDDVCDKFKLCSEAEGRCLEMKEELSSDFVRIEAEVQELTSKNGDLTQELFALGEISEELGKMKLSMTEISQEKENLTASLDNRSNEIIKFESELNSLKENVTSLKSELSLEIDSKERLRNELSSMTDQLNEKTENLLSLQQQEAELIQLRDRVLELESEKSHLHHELLDVESQLREGISNSSSIVNFEGSLVDLHEQLVASDVAQVFIRFQQKCHIEKLVDLLNLYEKQVEGLKNKNCNLENSLNHSIACEGDYRNEITKLLSDLELVRSESESYASENKAIKDSNNAVAAELDEYKNRAVSLEKTDSDDNIAQALRVQQLNNSLSSCLKEIDDIMLGKEELEIMCLVLQANLDSQSVLMSLLEEYDSDQIMLKKQVDELKVKLSEQNLKTEEFKNLSIHLKELKDKAESREKEDEEPSSFTSQESLRIVFIKEQYETKIQELKQQLSISKKHGEEILWKLQAALIDIENIRRSEASHVKKNEELSLKILELEDQLQSVLSDNRDKVKAYDHIKAELECSLISLECCKEEKQKLLASYEDCNLEKTKISHEVEILRSTLESSMAFERSPVMNVSQSGEQSPRDHEGTVPYTVHVRIAGDAESIIPALDTDLPAKDLAAEHGKKINALMIKDAIKSEGAPETEVQNLKSSMDLVNKVLERMKSENSILADDVDFEPYVGGLHRELIQLEKVNEELKNMSPDFNGFSGYGNSIERVLALVMELAETLQAKKKSSIQFQSSFLKQHNDEAAVFRSFKDINDLIKDMLELKGKHNAVETELQEMHERYSQLSLQFAEVEGERQKLLMTLKNVRSPKKFLLRSSSTSIE